MTTIHPKVAGATIGSLIAALAVAIVTVCGINVPAEISTPFTGLLAALGGWISPAPMTEGTLIPMDLSSFATSSSPNHHGTLPTGDVSTLIHKEQP